MHDFRLQVLLFAIRDEWAWASQGQMNAMLRLEVKYYNAPYLAGL